MVTQKFGMMDCKSIENSHDNKSEENEETLIQLGRECI
jgi:hypothetical protein